MSKTPTALDAFCCKGGTSRGLQMAGFKVTGVDLDDHSEDYAGDEFVQGDALDFIARHGHAFDVIVAGPPCQALTAGNAANPEARAKHPQLIAETRWQLGLTGRPWVIENVERAKSQLIDPILLCGRMFDLGAADADGLPLILDRHRLFESSVALTAPPHPKHKEDGRWVAGVYTGSRRVTKAVAAGKTLADVAPLDRHAAKYVRKGGYVPRSIEVQQALLGVDWIDDPRYLAEAIPPAYGEFIGAQLMAHIKEQSA